MINCVCLVVERQDKLLLVQARNRQKYYFPGGKIDDGERYTEALRREIREELQVDIPEDKFVYIDTVIGDAYPQKNMQTQLNCYYTTAEIDWNHIEANQEITDIQWIDKKEQDKIAPAVLTWIACQSHLNDTVASTTKIQLLPYNEHLKEAIACINITEADRKFTKTPVENIQLAKQDLERHPTLVFDDASRCVGFFTLHEGSGVSPFSNNSNAIFFRSFSIDADSRGKGFGKQVIQALPDYIKQHFSHIDEIVLTVNTDNKIAHQLYQQCHYENIGETILEDRPVYILSYKI
ncbi:GNAT family N-acetyltransferase [Staphylococcus caeli]|uniref:GNAT family N-acetyltransferase n=1 Tax=Staphylococcus caeli TaxID=2201815 RepID=UPI003F56BE86